MEGSQNTRAEFISYENELEGFCKSVFNECQLHMGITLTHVKILLGFFQKRREKSMRL